MPRDVIPYVPARAPLPLTPIVCIVAAMRGVRRRRMGRLFGLVVVHPGHIAVLERRFALEPVLGGQLGRVVAMYALRIRGPANA